MNHFACLGVPEHFELNARMLKRQLYQLQAQHHPDHAAIGQEAAALEQSSRISEAYRVLSDRQQRIKHLLQLRNALPEEGTTKLPAPFLMEMMELNEQLDDLAPDDVDGRKSAEFALQTTINTLESIVSPLMLKHDSGNITADNLSEIASYFLKMKYLYRFKNRLGGSTFEIINVKTSFF